MQCNLKNAYKLHEKNIDKINMSDSDQQLLSRAFLGKLIFNEIQINTFCASIFNQIQINTFCVSMLHVSVLLISSISSRFVPVANEYQDNERCKF
jgi:hypothetical protein